MIVASLFLFIYFFLHFPRRKLPIIHICVCILLCDGSVRLVAVTMMTNNPIIEKKRCHGGEQSLKHFTNRCNVLPIERFEINFKKKERCVYRIEKGGKTVQPRGHLKGQRGAQSHNLSNRGRTLKQTTTTCRSNSDSDRELVTRSANASRVLQKKNI